MVIRNQSKNLNGRGQLTLSSNETNISRNGTKCPSKSDRCLSYGESNKGSKERQGLAWVAGGISWRAVVFWRQGRGKVGNNQRTGIALINITDLHRYGMKILKY